MRKNLGDLYENVISLQIITRHKHKHEKNPVEPVITTNIGFGQHEETKYHEINKSCFIDYQGYLSLKAKNLMKLLVDKKGC